MEQLQCQSSPDGQTINIQSAPCMKTPPPPPQMVKKLKDQPNWFVVALPKKHQAVFWGIIVNAPRVTQ